MKAKIHPKLNDTTIIFPDGTEAIKTKTAANDKKLHVGIRFSDHPAWNRDKAASQAGLTSSNVEAFNNSFSAFFDTKPKTQ